MPPSPTRSTRPARSSPPTPAGATRDPGDAPTSTRQRILDVAVDLFTEQGYDGTSLREIAEEVGVTKAALYHHFAGKAEIVDALMEPFLVVQREWLADFSDHPTDQEWADALGVVIDWMVDNRRLFQLFERNREVFESLHAHGSEHELMHERIDAVLGDESTDERRRIRMAAALGTATAIAPMGSDAAVAGIDADLIKQELRSAVARALELPLAR